MTDLEITKLCAEAMGMRPFRWYPSGAYPDQDGTYEIRGNLVQYLGGNPLGGYNRHDYHPLHDDAQAMALVKKFGLHIVYQPLCADTWLVDNADKDAASNDLNRAICECVAKMQEAK